MAKRTFPDKELSAKAIKALMDARCLPSGPQQLDALKKAAQVRDAAVLGRARRASGSCPILNLPHQFPKKRSWLFM